MKQNFEFLCVTHFFPASKFARTSHKHIALIYIFIVEVILTIVCPKKLVSLPWTVAVGYTAEIK